MRYILISFFSIIAFSQVNAQQYITDSEVSSTAVVADNEMKILYFTASWCGPCRMMKPAIEAMDKDPESPGKIYKMDIDQNITDNVLKIPGVPTFMFLKNGTLVGQHTGAVSATDLKAIVAKRAALPPSSKLLEYTPVPSKYEVVAGAHPQLSKRELIKLWHNDDYLARMASSIHENLMDEKDLLSGLSLINRAIEINKNGRNLFVKSNLLSKLGAKKEALAAARKARSLMVSKKQFTGEVDQWIQQLKS
jgi:thioredoxin 1